MRSIAEDVAARHRLRVADLRGPAKARRFSRPRQEAYAAIRATGRYSLTQVGRFFGRHHSTVLEGAEAHANRQGDAQ